MESINRRIFVLIILLIALVGTTGVLYYSLSQPEEKEPPQKEAPLNIRPRPVKTISGYDNRRIKAPMAVAAADGELYVADSGNSRLLILTQAGTVRKLVKPDLEPGFTYPVGIAADSKKRLYLSTLGSTGKVFVYDRDGRPLYVFPEQASADASPLASPAKPVAVFAADDRLYVTDIIDQDIKVYDLAGRLLFRFGRPGSEKGEFLYPNGVAAAKDGTIFVSDSNNARVQTFNKDGEFLHFLQGPEKDPLALPRGIAIDRLERIHVVDTFKHKVFVFTKNGRFLFTYGKLGSGKDSFSYPNGIAIDGRDGTIFIADKMNNRISVWK